MDWLVIDGVKPWDGRYEFDLTDGFTTREWGWVKRYSGYMPLTVDEGFAGGDPELFATFAAIALRRAGIEAEDVEDVYDRFADAPFGSAIRLEGDPVEADAGPPPPSSNGNTDSSGAASTTSSDPSTATLPGSGMPVSAISGWPSTPSER